MGKKDVEVPDGSVFARGYNGQVVFDGSMVTISRRGFNARMSIGKGEKRIPLRHITAVQVKPAGAFVNGFIQFTVAGGNEARSRSGRQTHDAVRDENSVIFTKKQQREFDALRAMVETALSQPDGPAPAAAASPDVYDELRKLGELRDSGVLSEEEFAVKKKELLDRM